MKISISYFTDEGKKAGEKIRDAVIKTGLSIDREVSLERPRVKEWVKENFYDSDALIFIGGTGIAVRSIAPYIFDKTKDPAVIVSDEKLIHIIPILSGHIGRANEITRVLAKELGADPVITTATDLNNVFSIDDWAAKNNFKIKNKEYIKEISSSLLNKRDDEKTEKKAVLTISSEPNNNLRIIIRSAVLGIGCKKGKTFDEIENAFNLFLDENHIDKDAIFAVASIDLKKDEKGIIEFSDHHKIPFFTFSKEELLTVDKSLIISSSDFTEKITGVDSVSERAAAYLTGEKILIKKSAYNGITFSLSCIKHFVE